MAVGIKVTYFTLTIIGGKPIDYLQRLGYNTLMGTKINPNGYIGKKYGRLTILSVDSTQPRIIKGRQFGYRYYLRCKCECGNEKTISHLDILSGHTKSCGCILKESLVKQNFKHGHTSGGKLSHEWSSWRAMINRCYDHTSSAWLRYGAIGISVCDMWRGKDGFINFLKDMGDKPTPSHTIDRIDGTKHYCKENCRWATKITQNNNQKSNRKVRWGEKTYNISQLMRKLNIYTTSGVYYSRLDRGWSVEDTFNTPIKK